jgi:hypothetical protein
MKISNNSLVVLLFVAIVASVAGTFVSLNFMDDLITGAATTTGNVTLTIPSSADCTASDNLIAFGTLAQGVNNQSELALDFIVINNTGNVNLAITVEQTVDLFSAESAPSIYWTVHCNSSSTGTCNETYFAIDDTTRGLVTALQFADGSDNLTVGVNVTVPNDEPSGTKNAELTFTCLEG